MKKVKAGTVVLMVITLLIMATVNFSSILSGKEELQGGLTLLLIAIFVLLASICSIITKEVVLRGAVICKTNKPILYLTLIISMTSISLALIVFGVLAIVKR